MHITKMNGTMHKCAVESHITARPARLGSITEGRVRTESRACQRAIYLGTLCIMLLMVFAYNLGHTKAFATTAPDHQDILPVPPAKPDSAAVPARHEAPENMPIPGIKPIAGDYHRPPQPDYKPLAAATNLIDTSQPAKADHSDSGAADTDKPDALIDLSEQLLSFGKAPIPPRRPLPTPEATMAAHDADLYRQIFTYQSKAQWDQADKLIAQLNDLRLRGHVLFQRYMHPTAYQTSFTELASWLDLYADHPGAARIYRLALARMPDNYQYPLRKPASVQSFGGLLPVLSDYKPRYKSSKTYSAAQKQAINSLKRQIHSHLSQGGPTAALKALTSSPAARYMDDVEYDQLQARIANSYMLVGKLNEALQLAQASQRRSGSQVPEAGWVGGLAAWQKGQYRQAAVFFESAARSPYNSNWSQARSAYWTSRALIRSGQVKHVSQWLKQAAAHPRTFYGMIATRALGWEFDFNWHMPAYDEAHRKILMKNPAALRAQALISAGQYHLAEEELMRINPGPSRQMREALLAFADHTDLPALAMKIAQSTPAPDGKLYDAGLYPLAPWTPRTGYKVDKALIHALIRQESRFDPYAESHSGATGLMQLMPATASYVAGDQRYQNRTGQHSLKDPQLNLDIGQRYLQNLFSSSVVGNELFSLVTAYNAGPGNLAGWKRGNSARLADPLLFIETIPMAETRNFVEKVMANYWIYRLRLNQPTPSLDTLIAGNWPVYVRMDDNQAYRFAENHIR